MELISVIVPVYKVEEYLDYCVESILSQTYKNLEIILVDDGSLDHCPEICDKWALKDSRIIVIHKDNGGLSDARNAGMRIAKGEWIGFVDSDDWIAPDMYQRLIEAAYRDNCEIACCDVLMVWDDGTPSRQLTAGIDCVLTREQAQTALLREKELKQPVWYKLYRKDIVNNEFFDIGKTHEDVFWSYRVIDHINQVSVISGVGYYYRQRADSIMNTDYSEKRLDVIEGVCERAIYFQKHYPALYNEAICAIWSQCLYHGQLALQKMNKERMGIVFRKLESYLHLYPLHFRQQRGLSVDQKIWYWAEHISLFLTCKIRNKLKIGY